LPARSIRTTRPRLGDARPEDLLGRGLHRPGPELALDGRHHL